MTDSIRDSLAQVQELLGLAHQGMLYACIVEGTCCVHRDLQTPGGAGFMVDGETWNLADAEAIAASVNFLRTHYAEIAGALRDADRYRKLKEHFSARYHRATMDYWILDGEVKTASQFFTDEIDMTLDAALDAMQQVGGGGE